MGSVLLANLLSNSHLELKVSLQLVASQILAPKQSRGAEKNIRNCLDVLYYTPVCSCCVEFGKCRSLLSGTAERANYAGKQPYKS